MQVWLMEMVDTSCADARYIVWGNVFSTEEKAMEQMEKQVREDIEAGAVNEADLVRKNGGREITYIDGRMYYKVSLREIDKVE